MATLCRDCGALPGGDHPSRCDSCGSPRVVHHRELHQLTIAHIDCDAFFAAVEKRDDPSLADKPVIVGGRKRGVVAACCYIARLKGVHSAMPMFQALKRCPDAVVISPNRAKYSQAGAEIKDLMRQTTPLVEPLSIDEAFLDLSGTEKLHHGSPAQTLVKLVNRIEAEVGVTVSVGLSYNKFLAKTASDLDKPRGFAIIGQAEAVEFMSSRPVGSIWGVGKSMGARLRKDGIQTVGQIRTIDERDLVARYGSIGARLSRLARGEDSRSVNPRSGAKSISAETTFFKDLRAFDGLSHKLWPLCEKVAYRLKNQDLAASAISMKLKTSGFRILTRSRQLDTPTQLAEILYRAALPLLEKEADGRAYRLIGIGATKFAKPEEADTSDLLDNSTETLAKIEHAIDAVREKFGAEAIKKGRNFL